MSVIVHRVDVESILGSVWSFQGVGAGGAHSGWVEIEWFLRVLADVAFGCMILEGVMKIR